MSRISDAKLILADSPSKPGNETRSKSVLKSATKSSGNLPSTSQEITRDDALDFTKGTLVLIMLLYHWLNYFVSVGGFGFRYIRFITPSFVFLTGFIVTNILAARTGQNLSSLPIRLFLRSTKLLVLFTALNLGITWLTEGGISSQSFGIVFAGFIEKIPTIYLTGDGTRFSVLIPISYTLLLAATFQKMRDLSLIYQVATTILVFVVVSGLILSGFRLGILELVGAGLFGLIIGDAFVKHRGYLHQLWPWSMLIYLPHLAALTVWGVPYTLQLVSVCVNLSLLYCLGHLVRPPSTTAKMMLMLGRYTLMGYVGQIVILQILARTFRLFDLGLLEAPLALAAALMLTVILIIAIDFLRRRSRLVNFLYRLVFA